MTRVVNGIFDDVILDTGFFITDKQADIIGEWLESYASALEQAWKKRGSIGDRNVQKFNIVRSFARAIVKARAGADNNKQKDNNNG